MTTRSDPGFDQRLADWLEEDPHRAPPETVRIVLAAFPSIPQRRASRAPWRFLAMDARSTIAWMATAAIIVGALGVAVSPRDRDAPPGMLGPSPSPTFIAPADYASLPGWLVMERFGQAPDGSTTELDFDRRQILAGPARWHRPARAGAPVCPSAARYRPTSRPTAPRSPSAPTPGSELTWEVDVSGGEGHVCYPSGAVAWTRCAWSGIRPIHRTAPGSRSAGSRSSTVRHGP